MKNKVPTVYQNDEGDYWIRKDQVPELKDAIALAEFEYGGELSYLQEEVADLQECEFDCPGKPHPGHRRGSGSYLAYHFRYTDDV